MIVTDTLLQSAKREAQCGHAAACGNEPGAADHAALWRPPLAPPGGWAAACLPMAGPGPGQCVRPDRPG